MIRTVVDAVAVAVPNGLPRQRPLAEELAGPQHRHHRLLAHPGEHRNLDASFLDVHDGIARLSLGEHRFSFGIGRDASRPRIQQRIGVEGWAR
jgi:hypothetical protein